MSSCRTGRQLAAAGSLPASRRAASSRAPCSTLARRSAEPPSREPRPGPLQCGPSSGPGSHGGCSIDLQEIVLHRALDRVALHAEPQSGSGEREDREHGSRRDRRVRGPSSHPLARALEEPDRPGEDRLPAEEAPQVRGQLGCGDVPPQWILAQALEADRLQVARHARVQPRRRHWVVVEDLHLGSKRGVARETAAGPSAPA